MNIKNNINLSAPITVLTFIILSSHIHFSTSFCSTNHVNLIQLVNRQHHKRQGKYKTNAQISDKDDADMILTNEIKDEPIKTKTINDRLLEEVQREVDKTKGGPTSSISKKFAFRYGPEKTEEERLAALKEAQNLNGVDPWSTILSSFFALGMAFGVWTFTNYLGEIFATHPITTDVYFLQRVQSVFRNIVMGLFSLMSGFFGVNGLGILFLGLRVAYGVLTGELDPTIKNTTKDTAKNVNFSNVWDLMTMDKRNKKKNIFDDL